VDEWERLSTQRGQRSPGIKLASRPVDLRGTDVPAAEDLVSAFSVGPGREQGRFGGGELAVADVFLVGQGVVFRD
jgi:hypothetical protein